MTQGGVLDTAAEGASKLEVLAITSPLYLGTTADVLLCWPDVAYNRLSCLAWRGSLRSVQPRPSWRIGSVAAFQAL